MKKIIIIILGVGIFGGVLFWAYSDKNTELANGYGETKTFRFIYVVPNDVSENELLTCGITQMMKAYYNLLGTELNNGKGIGLFSSEVEVVNSSHPSSYYSVYLSTLASQLEQDILSYLELPSSYNLDTHPDYKIIIMSQTQETTAIALSTENGATSYYNPSYIEYLLYSSTTPIFNFIVDLVRHETGHNFGFQNEDEPFDWTIKSSSEFLQTSFTPTTTFQNCYALYGAPPPSGLIDYNSESNTNTDFTGYFKADVKTDIGQSFTGNGELLTNIDLYLQRTGSATGTMYINLYNHTGEYGVSSAPTGLALATSTVINVSNIPEVMELTTFTFENENIIQAASGTNYVFLAHYINSTSTNYIGMGISSPSTHSGNNYNINYLGSGSSQALRDAIFYAYNFEIPEEDNLNPRSYFKSGTIFKNGVTIKQ